MLELLLTGVQDAGDAEALPGVSGFQGAGDAPGARLEELCVLVAQSRQRPDQVGNGLQHM